MRSHLHSVPDTERIPLVVIGASAGGVEALTQVLSGLSVPLPGAVFIVLHLPAHSRSELPSVLQRATALPVSFAADGDAIKSGQVYVAPPDRHLMIEPGRVRLTRGPRECRVRPAIDVLFRSAAAACGPLVIGVVLSGALDDGTAGLWAIKDGGGVAIVQDPATAQCRSMPESAMQLVDVDEVLPLDTIGPAIGRHAGRLRAAAPAPASLRPSVAIETAIAREGNGLRNGVLQLGLPSTYSCPDCHRALVQIREGPIVRFRCHSGHAYSRDTLLVEINAGIDRGIWDAVRAVEERGLLLRDMAAAAERAGNGRGVQRWTEQARDADERAASLRALLLDHQFYGRDAEEA